MSTTSRNVIAFIALMIVVTVSTWVLGLVDMKYSVETEIAISSEFPGDLSLWRPAGDWSNVDISEAGISVRRDSDERSYAKRNYELPSYEGRNTHKLRIRGRIEAIPPIRKSTDVPGAAYMVWLQDEKGEVLQYLTIQDLTGSQAKYDAERIVSIPDSARSITLVLNSRHAVNDFSLTSATAQIISITPVYRFSSVALIFSWLVVFGLCVKWLYQNASRTTFTTATLLVAGIVIGVMLPETAIVEFVNPAFKTLSASIPAFDTHAAQSTYKLGHFLFFFLIAVVVAFNSQSLAIRKSNLLFILVLFAIASEGMQLHLFNRTTRFTDVGIDCAGILLGWLLASLSKLANKS